MPTRVEVTEKYWKVCWAWIFPYPCKKSRTVWKWRYSFSVIHQSCYVFYAVLYGCERGIEYKWGSGCFGWFDAYFSNKTKYFKKKLDSRGSCKDSLPPGGNIPPSYSSSNYGLRMASSSLIGISALVILWQEAEILRMIFQGVIYEPQLVTIMPVLSGILLLGGCLLSIIKTCQAGAMLSLLIAILTLIVALLYSFNHITITFLLVASIASIINLINSDPVCNE